MNFCSLLCFWFTFNHHPFVLAFFSFLVRKEQNLNQVLLQVWKDTRLSGIKWVPQFGECIGLVFPAARYFWGSVLERRTWVLGSDSLYPKPCKMEIRTLLPHRIMGEDSWFLDFFWMCNTYSSVCLFTWYPRLCVIEDACLHILSLPFVYLQSLIPVKEGTCGI